MPSRAPGLASTRCSSTGRRTRSSGSPEPGRRRRWRRGNQQKEPPKKAELPGKEKLTVPVEKKPDPVHARAAEAGRAEDKHPRGHDERRGRSVSRSDRVEGRQRRPAGNSATNGGAGTGSSTGIGNGQGSGLGEGERRRHREASYRPGNGGLATVAAQRSAPTTRPKLCVPRCKASSV